MMQRERRADESAAPRPRKALVEHLLALHVTRVCSRPWVHRVGLLTITSLLLGSCVTIPPGTFNPARTYAPRVEQLSVVGFDQTSTRTAMRYQLESTGCINVVDDDVRNAPERLEGTADARDATDAGQWALIILESATLLAYFGLPAPARVEATATGRLYIQGRPVRSYEARHLLPYWTILYTARSDERRAMAMALGRALRDIADQVAADLCGAEAAFR